jgi:predicted  nucleic acid-binding Zn-ribbon protein
MALRIETPKLKVNFLVLVGTHKDYVVPFESGLNIIYGDSDTGKSSILNLIDYCLGAKEIHHYDEIMYRGKYCLLDVNLKGVNYTIKRDIFDFKAYIEVYHCRYDEINNVFPKYYSPPPSIQTAPDGPFSNFLLDAMNIPLVKIKEAPTKENGRSVTLSFRDIFKYSYLDQDKIGSKKLFGDNPTIIVKLKETFKFMHNVLDSQITELEIKIAEFAAEKGALESKNNSVASFLKETQVETLNELKDKKEALQVELSEVKHAIKEIDAAIIHGSPQLDGLRITVNSEENRIRELQEKINILDQDVKQNVTLRNEYANDVRKMNATIEAITKLPKMQNKNLDCPICDSTVPITKLKDYFIDSSPASIKGELNALRRRMRDLTTIYERLKGEQEALEKELKQRIADLVDLKQQLDSQTVEVVSPYLTQRDSLSFRSGKIQSDINNIQHFYKIRVQQSINDAAIVDIDRNLTDLRNDLTKLKENAPSLSGVFSELGTTLTQILNFVRIKNVFQISISSKSYLPIIRNREYETITSGGVRTISSFAYYLSLMIYATEHPVNYPSFLMVDTVAKYLGKTKAKDLAETNRAEDNAEGMTDGTKYENIYKFMLTLQSFAESFQLIVVDNDIPEGLTQELAPYIRKYFSTERIAGAEIGFIDDFNTNEQIEPLTGMDDKIIGDIAFDEEEFPPF